MAGEGLDFKNIRDIHILEPWHNLSRLDQAIGRAIRNCSHIELPLEERNVNVYLYASSLPIGVENSQKETIDEYMYRKAENKDLVIKKIENILHKNSIDCILNKYGNILTKSKVGEYYLSELAPGYEDGSRECMYDKCNYSCNVDETELPTDKSTFDISFVSRQVQMIKLNIKKLFEKDVIYSLDSILSRIKKDKEIVYYSLNDMIKTKEIVYDKFNRTWEN